MLWNQLVVNGAAAGLVLALGCMGFALIQAGGRFYPFSYATVFAAGGYAFLSAGGAGEPVSLVIASAAGALLAWGCDAGVYGPLRRQGAGAVEITIASIGVAVIGQNVWSLMFSDATRMPSHMLTGSLAIGRARLGWVPMTGSGVALIVITVMAWLLRWTILGRRIRAVRDDRDLARALGFKVRRIEWSSIGAGGALVGLAGALVTWDVGAVPYMGQTALLSALVAVVVGGVASSFWVPAAAGFGLGMARELSLTWFPSQWREVATFVILLAVMAWRSRQPNWNLTGAGNL